MHMYMHMYMYMYCCQNIMRVALLHRRHVVLLLYSASCAAAEQPWAVVTGASSGIGRALALEACMRGYSVAVTARRASELQTLAAKIRSGCAVEALPIAVDLSSPSGSRKLHRATAHLPVKLVFLNAGFSASA